MFTERNIKAAFKMLCEMYDEEDRWMMDEDFFVIEGISNRCIAKALEERMDEVFEYKVISDGRACVDHRGKYLFDQRAVHILTVENFAVENFHYEMEYDAELWLLEDMSFAVVHCFRTMIEDDGQLGAYTEYRTVQDEIQSRVDLFFTIEELLEELDCICSLAESYRR